MKLAQIVFLALALLLVISLNVCSVESRRTGHHRRGEGHHRRGEGHHHDRDYDDDGDDDGDGEHHRHRRHRHRHHNHHASFYVFGDSFADNGNLPHWDDTFPALSRQWYFPYAGNGRFSNKMVESDFIANMLGLSEAPPAHALGTRPGRKGMNFAVGGSGVFKVPEEKPTLAHQIDSFFSLVESGSIDILEGKSVALVAVSGNDYDRIGVDTSAFGGITALADNVTSEIAANVARLQDLGVQKVLVNNLYPIGCAPSLSRPNNYTSCDEQGNQAAFQHNSYLTDKLADMDGVLILDLSAAFKEILNHTDSDDEVAQNFEHILRPCCESFEPSGYCGLSTQENSVNVKINRFKVCNDAESYFYWDDMHPTQAGWAAVMGQLESPIKEFLDIEY